MVPLFAMRFQKKKSQSTTAPTAAPTTPAVRPTFKAYYYYLAVFFFLGISIDSDFSLQSTTVAHAVQLKKGGLCSRMTVPVPQRHIYQNPLFPASSVEEDESQFIPLSGTEKDDSQWNLSLPSAEEESAEESLLMSVKDLQQALESTEDLNSWGEKKLCDQESELSSIETQGGEIEGEESSGLEELVAALVE